MSVRITHLSGRQEGLTVLFERLPISLGRDTSRCEVAFDLFEGRVVSALHARLYQHGDQLFVEDCRSKNHTYLDGNEVVEPAPVPDGAVLELGWSGPKVRLEYLLVAAPASFARGQVDTLVLEHKDGLKAGAQLHFQKSMILLGRDTGCDVCFDSRYQQVSRQHAKIYVGTGVGARIVDNGSQNGTYLNGRKNAFSDLRTGDTIQLGRDGPVLGVVSAPGPAGARGDRVPDLRDSGTFQVAKEDPSRGTVLFRPSATHLAARHELVHGRAGVIPIRTEVTVGRSPRCSVRLEAPSVSGLHAVFRREGDEFSVRDWNSTNGTFVNGQPIDYRRRVLQDGDVISLAGQFLLFSDGALEQLRRAPAIQAFGLGRLAPEQPYDDSGKPRLLLDDVTLKIEPGQFVGILGPAGAGKTTLLHTLNGLYPAHWGEVYLCGVSLYDDFQALQGRFGYVPQKDLVHEDLTVSECLTYAAMLRLASDTSGQDRDKCIQSVLKRVSLGDREFALIRTLSGGERKHVSTALELLAEPDILFLDEPTAGLDPKSETDLMEALRQLSSVQGKTIVVVTHLLGNVERLDKVLILVKGGRLAYAGPPRDALTYFSVKDWRSLYFRLDAEGDQWAERYRKDETNRISYDPPAHAKAARTSSSVSVQLRESKRVRAGSLKGLLGAVRQTHVLARRYATLVARNRPNLAVLLGGPVLLALAIAGTVDHTETVLAMLVFSSLFFGCFSSCREVVKERPIFLRERLFNLSLTGYIASKVLVLGLVVTLQALLMTLVLQAKFEHLGNFFDLWLTASLTGLTGLAEGLLLSAVASTVDVATSALTLLVVLQMLFSGVIVQPDATPIERLVRDRELGKVLRKVCCHVDPGFWAFDALKLSAFAPGAFYVAREGDGELRVDGRASIESLSRNLEDHRRKDEETWVEIDQAVKDPTAYFNSLRTRLEVLESDGQHKYENALRRDLDRRKAEMAAGMRLVSTDLHTLGDSLAAAANEMKPRKIQDSSKHLDRLVLASFSVVFVSLTLMVVFRQEARRRSP
ncbi:MAG: FHA domain-containing protein [Candidatus Riflebacteria bacterium]|nr:FHA domain-containing protein [Candidatus Riflebacteria bacterium]